jgi:MFS family permease
MEKLPARMGVPGSALSAGKLLRHYGNGPLDLLIIGCIRAAVLARLLHFSAPLLFQARLISAQENSKKRNAMAMTTSASEARRTIQFVNWAHALDHFVLLIFPTAVIAIAAELHRDYSDLIPLSTGAFVAFGLFALPVGWLADLFGRRALLSWFFFGYGASCLLVAASVSFPMLAASLLLLGIFSAIYHPIGSSMIVANATQLGRALGINGVWGNLGAAFASGISAALAAYFGWRAAFIVPGAVLIVMGLAFNLLVKNKKEDFKKRAVTYSLPASRAHLIALGLVFIIAVLAGGLTFNLVTIAMPKVVDERLGFPLSLNAIGWLTTGIFLCGALTQILVGRLIDRADLMAVFVCLAGMQPLGLIVTAETTGLPMVIGLTIVMAAIYGQVIVNDAMVGRYVPDEYRNRFYSLRFFFGFSVGGLAVPVIGALRSYGGFQAVLLLAGGISAIVFASALAAWVMTRSMTPAVALPAE